MTRPAVAALALLPIVLAGSLAGCRDGDGGNGPVATRDTVIVAQDPGEIAGHHSYVVVPGMRYDFTVSSATDRLPGPSAEEGEVSTKPPDGDRFLGVAWDRSATTGNGSVAMDVTDVVPRLALVVDGEPVDVAALSGDDAPDWGAWVVVPQDAEIGLQVEYDGGTQVIDDAYDAVVHSPMQPSSLYFDSADLSWATCPERTRTEGLVIWSPTCSAQVTSPLPYHSAVGWAEPDTAWVAVRVTVPRSWATYSRGDAYVAYDAEPVRSGEDGVSLRLDGEAPVSVTPLEDDFDQDDGDWGALAVFRVGENDRVDSLRIGRALRLTARDDDDAEQAGRPTSTTVVYRVALDI